ncbi:MAG: two-component system sensor histidine kinase NtrB [Syntrophothermus sp.]
MDNAQTCINIVDREGRLIFFNRAAEISSGYRRQDVLGKPFVEVFYQGRKFDAQGRYLNPLLETLETGREFQEQEQEIEFAGKVRLYNINTRALADGAGRMDGVLMAVRDITNERKPQEKIREAEKLAVLGGVASGLAHELKNSLTALRAIGQMLQISPEDAARFGRIIVEECDRLDVIINQLLSLARPSKPRFEAADLHKVIQDVLTLISSKASLHNVRIRVDLDGNLPQSMEFDPKLIKQLLLNLCNNALQAMETGGMLSVSTFFAPSRDRVKLRIADTGCGITAKDLPRIFEAFFTTKESGTGIGLKVCQQIVEAHGGEIEVRSEVGQGSVFTVDLPLRQKEPPLIRQENFTA